jgi:hypothetical protein
LFWPSALLKTNNVNENCERETANKTPIFQTIAIIPKQNNDVLGICGICVIQRSSRFFAITASAILLVVACLAVYAFWVEPQRLVITTVEIPIENLTKEIRMVMIADPQPYGPHVTAKRMEEIVARANELHGDIVVLLGDYVSTARIRTSFVDPANTIAALGRLKAPMGAFAVLGNHDWWWNGPVIRRLLAQQNIQVLEDQAVRAEGKGAALWIAGVSDPVTQAFDIKATLAQTDKTAPTILLTHTPDIFPDVPQGVDLTLAGHTHGGQVYIPGIGRPIVPSKYGERFAYGHIVENGHHLFVSAGIGTAIIPVRFLTPPEIVLITLTPAANHD